MIKLDPEEEGDDEDQPSNKTPQKTQMQPPNTSNAMSNDVTMNHQHTNNVQINMSRVSLPMAMEAQQNFVSCWRVLNFDRISELCNSTGESNQYELHPKAVAKARKDQNAVEKDIIIVVSLCQEEEASKTVKLGGRGERLRRWRRLLSFCAIQSSGYFYKLLWRTTMNFKETYNEQRIRGKREKLLILENGRKFVFEAVQTFVREIRYWRWYFRSCSKRFLIFGIYWVSETGNRNTQDN